MTVSGLPLTSQDLGKSWWEFPLVFEADSQTLVTSLYNAEKKQSLVRQTSNTCVVEEVKFINSFQENREKIFLYRNLCFVSQYTIY